MKLPSYARWMGLVATLAVFGALALALWIVGSPVEARKDAADQARINALRDLQSQIHNYYVAKKKLPIDLADLSESNYGGSLDGVDPITMQPFEYKVIDKEHYTLCAVFETDTGDMKTGYRDQFTRHPKGRFCFDLPVKL